MTKKASHLLIAILFLASNSFSVFANNPTSIDIRSKLQESETQLDLGQIVSAVVTLLMTLGAVALLLYFVKGAYGWMSAGGDKGKVEEARNHFTNGLIGMAILASVFAIYAIVDQFFGIGNIDTQPVGSDETAITPSTCFVNGVQAPCPPSCPPSNHTCYCTNGNCAF